MDESVLDTIEASLKERKENLRRWLSEAPAEAKASAMGPAGEKAVEARLEAIDQSVARAEAGELGVCTVCHDYVDTRRLLIDYTASVCIDHLSPEEAMGLERELELAQVVQQGLLPSEVPEVPGLELAAFTRPAQIIGGDYFDFLMFEGGDHGLALGDVAGHGVSASLHMAGLQALARALVPAHRSPSEVISQIHHLFNHNSRYTTFVTLFLAAFSPIPGTLTYCNAGHNPPFVVRDGAGRGPQIEWLHPTGAAIGLVEAAAYRDAHVSLNKGDCLVLYTDGVVEAGNGKGDPFGTERLSKIVTDERHEPARAIVQALMRSLEAFSDGKPLADDATLVVGKVG